MSVVLETDRLVLRHLEEGDLDALAALYADPEVRRYFPEGTLTREQTREEIDHVRHVYYPRHGYGLWATVLRGTGELVGRCGLLPQELDGRTEVEVAYLLGRRYWGRGYATEAARAVIDHAFATLAVPRVICMFDPGNLASRRVAEGAGLTPLRLGFVDRYGVSDVYAVQRPSG